MSLFSLAWLSLLSCIAGAEELLLDPEWPECVAGAGAETDSNPAPLTGPRHIGHRHGHSQRTIETLNPKKYFSVIFMRHDLHSEHSGPHCGLMDERPCGRRLDKRWVESSLYMFDI